MEKVTKYRCEICGCFHETEKEALLCEDTHKKPIKSDIDMHWNKMQPYPKEIIVPFQDHKSNRHDRVEKKTYRIVDRYQQ